jgi:subtilisin-like proprotein convertase family protein
MRRPTTPTRVMLVVLVGLLALPIAQLSSSVEAKKRPRMVTRTFGNPAVINLPAFNVSPAQALLYPSPIAVRGLSGRIRDVNVRLTGIQHRFPRDLEVLLVGPGGRTAVVMANAGQGFAINEVTLTLDDEAQDPLPAQAKLQSGAFRPTNVTGSAIPFDPPAPAAGPRAALSAFDGADPNGTWRLFVQDEDGPLNAGKIVGGWELEITAKVNGKKSR